MQYGSDEKDKGLHVYQVSLRAVQNEPGHSSVVHGFPTWPVSLSDVVTIMTDVEFCTVSSTVIHWPASTSSSNYTTICGP